MPGVMPALLTAEQLTEHLHASFPGKPTEQRMRVDAVDDETITVRMRVDQTNLRPGATISGPTLFTLADASAWLLTLAQLGPGRDAVTSSVTINYLRRPGLGDLVAQGRLLRLGKRSAVIDVLVFSDGVEQPVVQATVTYAPI
jgi:uncharacterized protein (TIGR00369 family)